MKALKRYWPALALLVVASVALAGRATSIDNVDRWVKGNLRVDGTSTFNGNVSGSAVYSAAVFDGGLGKFDTLDAGRANVVADLNVGGNANVVGTASANTMDAGQLNVVANVSIGGTLGFGVGANGNIASAAGSVSIITADVTSNGASNLISYTLPANALNTTNRCLRITGWGTALNNANAKTVALDFGSQTIITKVLTVSIANTTWSVRAVVCRSGSSTQDIYAEAFNPMGTAVSSVDGNTILYQAARTAGTQTDTAQIVIKGKTTVATTTDVTMDGMTVEFF